MKTPEEILFALDCCSGMDTDACEKCPYKDDIEIVEFVGERWETCGISMNRDAANLIRSLMQEMEGDLLKELKEQLGVLDETPPKSKEKKEPARESIIRKANAIAAGSRQGMYGRPEKNYESIAACWSEYLKTEVGAPQVATMMALLKIMRMSSGHYKEDNYVDAVNYLLLAAELEEAEGVKNQ